MSRAFPRITARPRIDMGVAMTVFALVVIGILSVSSASVVLSFERYGHEFYYLRSQVIYAVIGLVTMGVVSMIDYRLYRQYAYPLLIATIALLILVFMPGIGRELGGARAWIYLGPINFQPAEIAKLTLTLYLAAWFESQGANVARWRAGFLPFLTLIGLVATLLILQPDLGTLTIIVAIAAAMFFAAGAAWTQIVLGAVGAVAVLMAMIRIAPYRLARLTTFLDPTPDCQAEGYQICQSLLGIGSGGWLGLGFGQSRQKFLYLPQAHTDSIFVIMTEELGFLRVSLILLAFLFLAWRGLAIARRAPDLFGRLIATGITIWIVFETFVNVGAALNLLPVTGVTLPFISGGGTSLVVTLAAIGVLLNISKFQEGRD